MRDLAGVIGILLYVVGWLVGLAFFIWSAWFLLGGFVAFLTDNQVVFCPPLSPDFLCTPSG